MHIIILTWLDKQPQWGSKTTSHPYETLPFATSCDSSIQIFRTSWWPLFLKLPCLQGFKCYEVWNKRCEVISLPHCVTGMFKEKSPCWTTLENLHPNFWFIILPPIIIISSNNHMGAVFHCLEALISHRFYAFRPFSGVLGFMGHGDLFSPMNPLPDSWGIQGWIHGWK